MQIFRFDLFFFSERVLPASSFSLTFYFCLYFKIPYIVSTIMLDSSSGTIEMRSCKYTEFDEEFAMVRKLQVTELLL